MPRILVADDQADVLAALRLLLKGEGFTIETASSQAGVLKVLDSQELDIVLIDLNYARDTTSGSEGLDLLRRIQAQDPNLPVVVMTAWGNVDLAVEAMRRGARDFIQKPWDNARLLTVLRTQVELVQALRRGQRLEAENIALRDSGTNGSPGIIAESPARKLSRGRCTPSPRGRQSRSSLSTPAPWPRVYLRVSFSATCAARLPTPKLIAPGGSNWPTEELYFWTRLRTFRLICNRSFCEFWRPVSSSGSALQ